MILIQAIFSFCLLLIICLFICSSQRINLKRENDFLKVKADVIIGERVNFKLSLKENRPKLRRNHGLLPFLGGKSYDTRHLEKVTKYSCQRPEIVEEIISSPFAFNSNVKFDAIEIVATDDENVSDWGDFQGILGLNHLNLCGASSSLDPQAFINRIRGNARGFSFELPFLVVETPLRTMWNSKLDKDGFFSISNLGFGEFKLAKQMSAMIDIESNDIKVPIEIFNQITKKNPLETTIDCRSFTAIKELEDAFKDVEIWIEFASGIKLYFPSHVFWLKTIKKGSNLFTRSVIVQNRFVAHKKPFWSFGLAFLDEFKVSFDVVAGMIYFSPK